MKILIIGAAILKMVGLVGYAPTTFRMSSEHSTIELKAHIAIYQFIKKLHELIVFFFFKIK